MPAVAGIEETQLMDFDELRAEQLLLLKTFDVCHSKRGNWQLLNAFDTRSQGNAITVPHLGPLKPCSGMH